MQFRSEPVREHEEVTVPDAARLDGVLEALHSTAADVVAAYVVSVGPWPTEHARRAQLEEITGLVGALGQDIVGSESLALRSIHPRTFLGLGACKRIAARARELGATLLVVDAQLSPSQTRNLEDATGLSISDREIVILGVFQKHARSRMARIQVEIAHLEYLRPRIRGLGLDMDQQAGGVMNGKGAGETASELLARQLDGRMVQLKRSFDKLARAAEHRRKARQSCPRVALVGYTNAGKTSLMNALTGAELSTRARPFETLDTTMRTLTRHGGDVLIGDTVGFIRDLPERLLASFASTLAEARDATLHVIVLDASDPEWPMHLETTEAQLEALGCGDTPRQVVFNKVDRCEVVPVGGIAVSAFDGDAVDRLRQRLIARSREGVSQRVTVDVPYEDADVNALIHGRCRVLDCEALDAGMRFTIEGPAHVIRRVLDGVQA